MSSAKYRARDAYTLFVKETIETGAVVLSEEFDESKRQTQSMRDNIPRSAFLRNMAKNRYKDIICADHNRVVLKWPEGEDDYIHANWVHVEDGRKYICTQAPIPTTTDDFWRMIWQEKCK